MKWCSELSWGNSQYALRGVADLSKKWRDNTILKVQFLDGEQWQKQIVADAFTEWQKHIGLQFLYVETSGVIRLSFKGDEAWSWVGTDAIMVLEKDKPTMMLGGFTKDRPLSDLQSMSLHEIGHALGLKHGMYNHSIPWNKEVVYEYYKHHHGWSKAMVDHNVFGTQGDFTSMTIPDMESVMLYPIPPEFTDGQFVVATIRDNLSELDIQTITELYPKRSR